MTIRSAERASWIEAAKVFPGPAWVLSSSTDTGNSTVSSSYRIIPAVASGGSYFDGGLFPSRTDAPFTDTDRADFAWT